MILFKKHVSCVYWLLNTLEPFHFTKGLITHISLSLTHCDKYILISWLLIEFVKCDCLMKIKEI